MREEYDLKQLRVKRRGPPPGLEAGSERPPKVRITIALDQDLVEHFKEQASRPGGLPYQTQINLALRKALELEDSDGWDSSAIKEALLEDAEFVETLAAKVGALPPAAERGPAAGSR